MLDSAQRGEHRRNLLRIKGFQGCLSYLMFSSETEEDLHRKQILSHPLKLAPSSSR